MVDFKTKIETYEKLWIVERFLSSYDKCRISFRLFHHADPLHFTHDKLEVKMNK